MVCSNGRRCGRGIAAAFALWIAVGVTNALAAEMTEKDAEIRWETSYKAAVTEAQKTGKSVYVHVSATWCGACQSMKAQAFSAPEVRKLLAAGFVPCLLDADAQPALVAKFQVEAYPTGIVVSPDLIIRKRITGAKSAGDLRAILASLPPATPVPMAVAKAEPPASALIPENLAPTRFGALTLVARLKQRASAGLLHN